MWLHITKFHSSEETGPALAMVATSTALSQVIGAPIAAGLILAAALTLVQASEGGPYAWVVAALSTLVLSTTKISPFLLLGIGAAAFVALGVG